MRNPFRNPFGPFKQARGWAKPKSAAVHVKPFDGVDKLAGGVRSDLFKLPKLQPMAINNWVVQCDKAESLLDSQVLHDKLREFLDQPAFKNLANVEARIALQMQEARDKQLFFDPDKLRGLRADVMWMDDPVAGKVFGKGIIGRKVEVKVKPALVPESSVPAIRELDAWSREFRIAMELSQALIDEANAIAFDIRSIGGDDLEFVWGEGKRRHLAEFFSKAVKDAGMMVYGGGNFSIAFGVKDSDRIYKLSIRGGDAGVYWNKLCYRKWRSNRHLPAVHELHEFSNGVVLTQTERLTSRGRYENKIIASGQAMPWECSDCDSLSDLLHDAWNGSAAERVMKSFGMSAVMCLQRIGLWKERNQVTGDLHSDNYMFRDDGTIVFTDPVSYLRGGEPNVNDF